MTNCTGFQMPTNCPAWNKHLQDINEILAGMNINIQVDEHDHRNSSVSFNYLPVEFHKVYTLSTDFLSVAEMRNLKRQYDSVFAPVNGEGMLQEKSRIIIRTIDSLFLLDTQNVRYTKLKLIES